MQGIGWTRKFLVLVVSSLLVLGIPSISMADGDDDLDADPPVAVTDPAIKTSQGMAVNFNGSTSTDNVGVVGWNWTFASNGGSVTLIGPTPVYVFNDVGVFVVTLKVVDAAGNTDEAEVVVTVREAGAPTAVAGEDIEVDQDTTVLFDGSDSTDNDAVVGWNWTFVHDGAEHTLLGHKPSFTFSVLGEFVVTLTVVDAQDLTDTDTVTVTVRDTEPPLAEAGEYLDVMEGEEFTLDGSASTDNVGIVEWTWTIQEALEDLDTLHGETTTGSVDWDQAGY